MDRTCRTVAFIGSLAMTGTILLGGCGGGSTAATAPTPGGSASSVPSSPASGSPEGLESAGIEAKGAVVGSGRILVVDDSTSVRLIGCRMLNSLGYQCAEASDGMEGLEKAEQETFAAILVDWQMPNIDGIDITKKLRARGVATKIIIMLTSEDRSAIINALIAGADYYLLKPFTIEDLDNSLRGS
jgi:CheY-like chemotaxis protein